jgi:hypothetical protein
MRTWISLKISILYQLLEFDVQHYWYLKTNEDLHLDREQSQWTAKVLTSLRDTLEQLIDFLPRVLLVTTRAVSEDFPTSRRSQIKFLNTFSIPLDPREPELLTFIYHTAVLLRQMLADNHVQENAIDATLSSLAILRLSDSISKPANDPFASHVHTLSMFFAGLILKGSVDHFGIP